MAIFFPQVAATLRVVWENFGDDVNPLLKAIYTVPVQGNRVNVNINSYAEADTFELELDYKVFPFDPRAIRSLQVSIHMEDMERLEEDGAPKKIQPTDDNRMFMGFADEDEMTFNDNARSVKLKGRDFTGLLIDAKWPGRLVSLDKTVMTVLNEILQSLQATQDIFVENRTGLPVLPILAKFFPDFGKLSGKRNAKQRETYWDVIQDIVSKAGLIAYIELDKLILTKPRTLYDSSKAVKFVYGRNVTDLQMTRKMGRQKGFNVVVRSVIQKEVVKVEIPKDSTNLPEGGEPVRIAKQSAGGVVIDKSKEESLAPFLAFAVANVRDKAHLIEIGEKIFEELGRQQIEGRFKTADMCAPTKDNADFNLLQLRVGTPVSIVIGIDDLEKIQEKADAAERLKYLIDRKWQSQVANVFAQQLGKKAMPFYTKAVSFTMDAQNGFVCEVEFLNFIETSGKGLGI